MTNVIHHGCKPDHEHTIDVRLSWTDGEFTAIVADDGRPFDPLNDWATFTPAMQFLEGSSGRAVAPGAVVPAVVLAAALLASGTSGAGARTARIGDAVYIMQGASVTTAGGEIVGGFVVGRPENAT